MVVAPIEKRHLGYGSGSRILKIVLTADEQHIVSVMALGED
jgi:hypothetical protein